MTGLLFGFVSGVVCSIVLFGLGAYYTAGGIKVVAAAKVVASKGLSLVGLLWSLASKLFIKKV